MATKSDFMAAEEIKAILHGRDNTEQERIIRWVGESLGIVMAAPGTGERHVAPASPPSSAQHAGQIVLGAGGGRPKDIKTFVGEKQPKSDLQFTAVVAYFFRYEAPQADRKETIQAKDLQDAGRQARGIGFDRPLTTLNNAVAQGYFDRAARGEFKLNAVGENLVAMTLPSTGGSANGNKPRQSKKKVRAKQSKSK